MNGPPTEERALSKCIWYISKYVAIPDQGEPVSRPIGLLRETARRGFRTLLITASANYKFANPDHGEVVASRTESVDGIEVIRVPTTGFKSRKSFRRMLSWISFEVALAAMPKSSWPKPDVVVVSSLSLLTVLNGLALKWRYGCRLVFEVRDIWPLTLVAELGYRADNPLVRLLAAVEKLGYLRSDAIVGTMPNLSEHVAAITDGRRSAECVPMGVDTEAIDETVPLPAAAAAALFPPEKFIVGYAGSVSVSNALETFLECARSLAAHEGVHFALVGDGDLHQEYVDRFGSLPNVTIGDAIPREQVQSFLSRCDLLYFAVHKSQVWQYGLSLNKLIDYMMSAKPIVASYSGYPSMVNEADCGTFVPAADVDALRAEILRYEAMSPAEREQVGRRGRSWLLQHRAYDRLANDYLAIMFPEPSQPTQPDKGVRNPGTLPAEAGSRVS